MSSPATDDLRLRFSEALFAIESPPAGRRRPSAQLAVKIRFDLLCGATSYAPGRWASLLDTL
jgi:hypothetical protein